ncbi:guanylate kinase [Helcococcus kunzii]|uniref:guanylate kinase n=1 Tax=Helcococcus kunzii TaxID=40091 RepID=UPI001BAEB1BF|nr:guanylate kinase [Helcococcus kunzii]MCT1795528.1 guanylate kinase [Helcococcus kunzii]MCT1989208.1 guanylate kinase [Helcococcus kunzii]QUY64770.1 guanylate kinase [Helcococcus kunzii]QZO77211.1 guanylate kinase [Helcococcus kunzii]
MEGFLLVVSGPTAAGKGTIVKELLKIRKDVVQSISVTSRYKRINEEEGREYFFKTKEEFEQLIEEGQLLEYATVHGNYYGTPKKFVEENIKLGKVVILEIDVQGAQQVREKFDNQVSVFVIPPRKIDIENRLRHRGTETEEMIKIRLETAEREFDQIKYYDYFLVNDYVDVATKRLENIIDEEREEREKKYD